MKNNSFVAGYQIIRLDKVDSTNSYAKVIATEYSGSNIIIIADKQLQGRGRKNREWLSIGDHLTFSLLLKQNTIVLNITDISCFPLMVAAALCEAIRSCCKKEVYIKWPNDIYYNNKKIAGILVESTWRNTNIENIIVGIGINVNGNININSDELILKDADFLANRGFDKFELLEVFLKYFNTYLSLSSDKFFILSKVREYSMLINQDVLVHTDYETKAARAINIADDGGLLVEFKNGEKEIIYADDVSVKIHQQI